MLSDEQRLLINWLKTPRTSRELLRRCGNEFLATLRSISYHDAEIMSAFGSDKLKRRAYYWTRLARDGKKQLRVLGFAEVDTANARRVN